VRKQGELLALDFPADQYQEVPLTDHLRSCTDAVPLEAYKGKTDYMLVYGSRAEVIHAKPDLGKIAALDARGLIITARGKDCDFVSRFFAPQSGIAEDPVTGSAHTTLVPYWRKVLGKDEFNAMQLSPRRGWLSCKWLGRSAAGDDRVEISGRAVIQEGGNLPGSIKKTAAGGSGPVNPQQKTFV
jgi:predicted PhzF superfamily epimerase YddE/YHI9